MKKISVSIFFLLFIFAAPALAEISAWPRLSKESDGNLCGKALKIAEGVFLSDAFYLFAPPTMPDALGTKLVIQPEAVDISGGNALVVDNGVFQEIPKVSEGPSRSIVHWQVQGGQSYRWALEAGSVGWRGDSYALFSVRSEIAIEEFIAYLKSNRASKKGVTEVSSGWRPPLMLQEVSDAEVWAIEVGEPYVFLSEWNVHRLGDAGAEKLCTVKFRKDVKKATDLLPPEIGKLDGLLQKTQATHEDGTLQPTGRIRNRVNHTWANIAMRPWVVGSAYNDRDQVDASLKEWSKDSAYTKRIYQQIYSQYPLAERALKNYYRRHFKKSDKEAQALASSHLDIAFRTYFVFPR